MGTYNTLTAPVVCRFCHQPYEDRIQFKYSHTRQLGYVLGQRLLWDRFNIGEPGTEHVVVYGISEAHACPRCGHVYQLNESPEYDIHVREGILYAVGPMKSYELYLEEEGGRFYMPPA